MAIPISACIGGWIYWFHTRIQTLEDSLHNLQGQQGWLFDENKPLGLEAELDRFVQKAKAVKKAMRHLEGSENGD